MTIETEYARLKALAEKATPGPWNTDTYSDHDGPPDCDEVVVTAATDKYIAPVADAWPLHWCERSVDRAQGEVNAAFIASAHDMMALIERLVQERARAISAKTTS